MSDCCICSHATLMMMYTYFGGVRTEMPLCHDCHTTFPEETLDKILKAKYNANARATKHKEDTMCCNDRDDFIKFQCKHLDGTNIEMTMPTELTWNELGEQFRNFVSACGYIITREDCLCGAEPEQHIVQAAPMEHLDFNSIFDEIIDEMEVKPKKKSKKKSKKKKGIK